MKKLLIVQLDETYFLHETLRVLEKSYSTLKEFELTVLVSEPALQSIQANISPLITGITTNKTKVLSEEFDLCFNLSLNEAAWTFHDQVNAQRKHGPMLRQGQLIIPDFWSTFLLTIKAQAPFLTFHLQDIYKNILGIKRIASPLRSYHLAKEIIIGRFNDKFVANAEHEKIISQLKEHFPLLVFKNISEVDLISDFSHTLYLGPATLEALHLCEAGAQGIFIGRQFVGLNLLPHDGHHYYISTRGEALRADKILPFIENYIRVGKPLSTCEYSLYRVEDENLYGTHLESLNQSDTNYPFFQSHVVLWNFILNLFDVNLAITPCNSAQIEVLTQNQFALTKLLRLHEYALKSADNVYHEAKAEQANGETIEGHLKNLREIDEVLIQIAKSHQFLRPFLDFYRIRKGQNEGITLLEQIQHTFLTLSEEHHALTALSELFSVTLRKNEVSI